MQKDIKIMNEIMKQFQKLDKTYDQLSDKAKDLINDQFEYEYTLSTLLHHLHITLEDSLIVLREEQTGGTI